MRKLMLLLLIAAAAWAGYFHILGIAPFAKPSVAANATPPPPASTRDLLAPPHQAFRCDGRTHCSQMRSCEEATYFLKHCPNTKMDGNGDGVPCERQWCG